ncbi:MAG: hypothetical protein Q7T78_16230, partial [Rhodoferax sp.]|nr:hypothetical protein [Rhodoferax sp.]
MMKLCSGLWRVARSVFGLLLACLALQTQALTLELREAQAVVTVQGHTTSESVSLPYHWDRRHNGLPGAATFEVPFELNEVP